MNHSIKATLVVTAFAIVTSCSLKTLYNNLDYLVPEYVEGLVTLDELQETEVDQRTVRFLSWHRQSELKRYAGWLQDLQQDVLSGLTETAVLSRVDQADHFWRVMMAKINQQMAELLPMLTLEQQAELFASIAHKNERFREKYVDINKDERIEAYEERLADNYDNWLGSLNPEQEQAIKETSRQLVGTAELWLQRRLSWQFGIQKILQTKANSRAKEQQLHTLFERFVDINNPILKENSELNRRLNARLAVAVAQNMSQKQRDYFKQKTDDYIRMLNELAEHR